MVLTITSRIEVLPEPYWITGRILQSADDSGKAFRADLKLSY
jgi:hypothetical protein